MDSTIDPSVASMGDVDSLLRSATALDSRRLLVAEHAVKAFLRSRGLAVPKGAVAPTPDALGASAGSLREPLALKAFGPGIVHKTELGAVSLDARKSDLARLGGQMAERLAAAGHRPDGYLVEEQQPRGVELLIGVVIKEGVGIVVCGLGGIYTEALADFAIRLLPLAERDADEMLRGFKGAALLDSARAGAAADRSLLRELLLKLAGRGGIAEELQKIGMLEFECNPVIVTLDGPCIADARLLLEKSPAMAKALRPGRDLAPLFKPTSIAIAGVSASGRGFGNVSLESYRRMGWTDGLYVIHPTAKSFGDTPAFASLADVPGGRVDHLRVTLPAREAVAFVAAEAFRARTIQVITGGFGEMGGEHRQLEDELLDAVRKAGVPLVGPNCVGTYCPAGRQAYQLHSPKTAGTVSIVSQSGGVCSDIVEVGGARGLVFAKVLSVGNANDVSPAEVLEYLVNDPDTAVIGMYLEDMRDRSRLVRALRAASGKKPVVVVSSGATRAGTVATASHTGAMATDTRLLEAMRASTGLITVNGTEDLIGALLALQQHAGRTPEAGEPAVLIVGHGGGHTVLSADACERAGLHVPALTPAAIRSLAGMKLGIQKLLVNPLELILGPMTTIESTREVMQAVLSAQPFTDVLLHLSVRTFYAFEKGFFEHGAQQLDPLLKRLESLSAPLPGKPRIFVSARATEVAPGEDTKLLMKTAAAAGLPLYFSGEEATRAMRAVRWFDRFQRMG